MSREIVFRGSRSVPEGTVLSKHEDEGIFPVLCAMSVVSHQPVVSRTRILFAKLLLAIASSRQGNTCVSVFSDCVLGFDSGMLLFSKP